MVRSARMSTRATERVCGRSCGVGEGWLSTGVQCSERARSTAAPASVRATAGGLHLAPGRGGRLEGGHRMEAIHRRIEQQAVQRGDIPAVIDPGGTISYRTLNGRANTLA